MVFLTWVRIPRVRLALFHSQGQTIQVLKSYWDLGSYWFYIDDSNGMEKGLVYFTELRQLAK
jgi:hypothetical protein